MHIFGSGGKIIKCLFRSHAWNLKNDYSRLVQIRERVDVMPLGSGALAGNPFDIDRSKLAEELEFSKITNNSVQAVGDRDFVGNFVLHQIFIIDSLLW